MPTEEYTLINKLCRQEGLTADATMCHVMWTNELAKKYVLKRIKQTCNMFSFVYMLEMLFLADVLHKHLCIVIPQYALFLQCLFDVSWWSAWWGATYIDNRRHLAYVMINNKSTAKQEMQHPLGATLNTKKKYSVLQMRSRNSSHLAQ